MNKNVPQVKNDALLALEEEKVTVNQSMKSPEDEKKKMDELEPPSVTNRPKREASKRAKLDDQGLDESKTFKYKLAQKRGKKA